MRKRLSVILMAAVIAVTVMGCGGSKDKDETTTKESGSGKIDSEETTKKTSDEEDDDKDKTYVMKTAGEDVNTMSFGCGLIDYYGPECGYTEIVGGERFEIKGQVLFVAGCYNDELKNKELEDQMDIWFHEFNTSDIGGDAEVKTWEFNNDISNAWTWKDKQEYKIVEVNGRECVKFSGVVSAISSVSDSETSNYVTGYIFNIKHKCKDGTVYTEPMAFLGAYSNNDWGGNLDSMTEEQKKDLNYNVDLMMESMTLDQNVAELYDETLE